MLEKRSDRSGRELKSIIRTQKKNKKKDTPWGEHVLCYHGDMDLTKGKTPIFTARILAFEENIIERKAREAVEIRDRKPGINRNGGWQLD